MTMTMYPAEDQDNSKINNYDCYYYHSSSLSSSNVSHFDVLWSNSKEYAFVAGHVVSPRL
jgi:hypothetical protein